MDALSKEREKMKDSAVDVEFIRDNIERAKNEIKRLNIIINEREWDLAINSCDLISDIFLRIKEELKKAKGLEEG